MQTRAFTLIELLVTVTIIGLLTTIATASFVTAQQNNRDDARKVAASAVATAVETYKITYGRYPGLDDTSDAASSKCAETASHTYYYNPNATCPSPLFDPTPNWIPGLGKFLNPPAIEKRYTGATNGSTSSSGTFDTNTGAPTGTTRTFSYKKSASGYYIHTRLEKNTAVFSISK